MSEPVRVLFLGHAAERTGPPLILLELLRWIRTHTTIEPGVVLQEGGPLLSEFQELAPTWIVSDWLGPGLTRAAEKALQKLHLPGVGHDLVEWRRRRPARAVGSWPVVYVNCAGTARLLPLLPRRPDRVIAHIHELSTGLEHHLDPATRADLFGRVDGVITVSDAVTAELVARGLVTADQVRCIHGCIELDPDPPVVPPHWDRLGISEGDFVVGTAGVAHWRKAPDLFVSVAQRVIRKAPDTHFVWLGGRSTDPSRRSAERDVRRAGLEGRVHFLDHQDHPRSWFAGLDVFFLPAREDAYPLVCLEAAAERRPVVCFESGGAPEFVRDDAGIVVPYPDLDAAAGALLALKADARRRATMGSVGRLRVEVGHRVEVVAPQLVAEIDRVARS